MFDEPPIREETVPAVCCELTGEIVRMHPAEATFVSEDTGSSVGSRKVYTQNYDKINWN